MQLTPDTLILSASDLVGHLACAHLTALDLEVAKGLREAPEREDDQLELIREKGFEHEQAYLERLRGSELEVVEIPDPAWSEDPLEPLRERARETLSAMHAGADVIFQATFLDEGNGVAWRGHADFLRKVDRPSRLGSWSYEPEDTKLARRVKPGTVLQLCHYAEHLERLQGTAPERVHVTLGDGRSVSLRLAAVSAYYRAARERFLRALGSPNGSYPFPVAHCAVCRWAEVCEAKREEDDHLCRVAGLSREQARKLELAGVGTLAALADAPAELTARGISGAVLDRLRRQARLQRMAAPDAPPPVELRADVEEGRGLAALPEPSPGDLFYDIEGDPYVGRDGLEYLHGLGWAPDGEFDFRAIWARSQEEERRAFEEVIDFIVERRRLWPDMHVYHYAPYETAALGRLMGRYGTREEELDDLLRGGVFVDLYRVVRQGLLVGSDSYSIKKLEPLYMEGRTGEVTDAGSSIVEFERWRESGDPKILESIQAYNMNDVESTWLLRGWLEGKREDLEAEQGPIPRAARDPMLSETPEEDEDDSTRALRDRLLGGLREAPAHEDADARARWLAAHLLAWHRREAKPEWWRYFERILDADEQDFYEESEAIGGLELVPEQREAVGNSLIWTYRFDPDQDFKFKVGDKPLDPAAERDRYVNDAPRRAPGEVAGLDPRRGLIRLKRAKWLKGRHPRALIPPTPYRTVQQRESLERVAKSVERHGTRPASDAPHSFEAARRLLAGLPPRIRGVVPGAPLRAPNEPALEAAIRLALGLDRSTLAIQGPPGSGKTYTAARVIVALVRDGRQVGITANSHQVISNLLDEVMAAAEEAGVSLRAVQAVSKGKARCEHPAVRTAKTSDVAGALATKEVDVAAGTSWLFARSEMVETLDTLVVDEAGQLSLANVVAVAPAAENLILVGDPRQLAQPSKGTHPPGAGVSALEHVLGDEPTVPDHLGLFLDRSWRMHPDVCHFISEQVYGGRLESHEATERQRILNAGRLEGTGIRWLGVDHAGNSTSSMEEVEAVAKLFHEALGGRWLDEGGADHPLGLEDILVVAPYNAQVNRLLDRLPDGARVGTVDRFQGQEAPLVLVSLTASSARDVPRGLEFLYSRNRLNVAVSRAKAMCVVVGSPELAAAECRSVEQIELVNAVCRLLEVAGAVEDLGDAREEEPDHQARNPEEDPYFNLRPRVIRRAPGTSDHTPKENSGNGSEDPSDGLAPRLRATLEKIPPGLLAQEKVGTLGLRPRIVEELRRAGVAFVADLVRLLSSGELQAILNAPAAGISDIHLALERRLREGPAREASPDQALHERRGVAPQANWKDRPVQDLDLSNRSRNFLMRAGAMDVGQAVELVTQGKLWDVKGVGSLTVKEIEVSLRAFLAEVGAPPLAEKGPVDDTSNPPPSAEAEDAGGAPASDVEPFDPGDDVTRRILHWMRERPGLHRRREVFDALRLSEAEWRPAINELLAARAVEKVGGGRGTRYRVAADGPAPPVPVPPVRERKETVPIRLDAAPFGDLLAALPELAEKIAEAAGSGRDAEVLRRYYGLDGGEDFTLEEIGAAFGLTRERIRQLKQRMCERLAAALQGDEPIRRHRAAEWIVAEAVDLRVLLEQSELPQPERVLAADLQERYGRELTPVDHASVPLLLELLGATSVRGTALGLQDQERYWSFGTEVDSDRVAQAVRTVRALLRDRLDGVVYFRLAVEVNKAASSHWNEGEVRDLLGLMEEVETLDDEWVRLRFEALPSNADRAYRVLFEEGQPLHFREIAKRINHRYLEAGLEGIVTDPRVVSGPMSTSDLFEPIGRSGKWKLASWEHVRSESIVELMTRCVAARMEPVTYDEIHAYVTRHRPDVPRETILALAHMYPEQFLRSGRGSVALASWGLDPNEFRERRSSEDVHEGIRDALLDLIEEQQSTSLMLAHTVREIRERTNIPDATVRAKLAREGWALIEDGQIRIDEQALRDAEAVPARRHDRSGTVRARVATRIREYLAARENRTAAVRRLRRAIRARERVKDPTIYWVLDQMDDVRKVTRDGVLMAVLVTDDADSPQQRETADPDIDTFTRTRRNRMIEGEEREICPECTGSDDDCGTCGGTGWVLVDGSEEMVDE